jgi:hypothetical protein
MRKVGRKRKKRLKKSRILKRRGRRMNTTLTVMN